MPRIGKSQGIEKAFNDVFPIPINAGRAPTSADVKFPIGQIWLDTVNGLSYILAKVAAGAATWNAMAPGASDVDTLSGDSGGNRPPTAGNVIIAGGTNITSAGAGSTITVNLDAAITLATSVTAPIYTTSAADMNINSAASQDIILQMGDAAGAQKISFEDSASAEVANLDSDGQLNLLAGDAVVTRSAASADVTAQVTNSDNTAADSDAFVEVAVGGTSGGNPGVRFQISGGQNYSMGIDNADSDKLVICADNDLGTDVLMKMDETTKDVEIAQGNLVIGAVAKQLQMNGGAVTDFIGQATLVSGTVTIANTNIAAGDRIMLTRADANSSTALGLLTITAQTASTSFVITALDPSDGSTTITGDVSIVNYFIVRQN